MRCPHGGAVRAAQGAAGAVHVAGAPAVAHGAAFTVVGCPHTDGRGVPRPCVTVRFTPDTGGARVLADGRPLLLSTTAGQCFAADLTPQGPPLVGGAQQGVSCR
nr:hypothetical protein [Streptomyces sp. HNM0575]